MHQPKANVLQQINIRPVSYTESGFVLEGYALLQEVMGTEAIENLGSFMETVSPLTDPYIVPKLVCALNADTMVGVIAGGYLCNLNMGFIAYSAVTDSFRKQGIYTGMRNELVELLNSYANRRVSHIISELDGDGWLYDKYLRDWDAFALPCEYEQPEAQGLCGTPMKLVLQPLMGETVLDYEQIIREVYERVYRIRDVEDNVAFRRIVDSINR